MKKFKPPTLQEIAEFDKARKLWPGVKRGRETEFVCLKKHKDWKDVVPLLYPAIEQQIIRHHNKAIAYPSVFVPPWKNFKTWLNNRCWEEVEGTEVDPAEERRKGQMCIEKEKQKTRDDYDRFFREKTIEELKGFLVSGVDFYRYHSWLIKEIISEKQKL